MVQNAILVASFLGALSSILAFLLKTYNLIRRVEKKFDMIEAKFDTIESNLRSDSMYIYKIAVMSEELPLVDRIRAGEQYLAMGGNGIIKKKYEELLNSYN